MKAKAKVKPLCETAKGCPIYDIASDIDINREARKYIAAKQLSESTGSQKFIDITFEELGLFQDTESAVQLEIIWQKHIMREKEKAHHGK